MSLGIYYLIVTVPIVLIATIVMRMNGESWGWTIGMLIYGLWLVTAFAIPFFVELRI